MKQVRYLPVPSFVLIASSLLFIFVALAQSVMAAELTAMERLCASYEKKKIMLEKRVKRGVHPWEKEKIKEQFAKLAADSAKHCSNITPAVKQK